MNPAESSSDANRRTAELLSAVESCWRRTVEILRPSFDDDSMTSLGATATRLVEEAVFLGICHRRGFLNDVSNESSRASTAERLGMSLFQVRRDERPAGCLSVGHDFVSDLTRFEVEPETLGAVHHRLLGSRVTTDRRSRLEFRRGKATAKAGGVFYTPGWVTRYMVDRAFECLDDGPSRTVDGVPRILDPACGCGAFLLAVYRRLRDGPTRAFKDGQAVHGTRKEQAGDSIELKERRTGVKVQAGGGKDGQAVHGTREEQAGDYARGEQAGGDARGEQAGRQWCRRAVLECLCGVDLDEQAVLTARRAVWLAACDDPAGRLSPEETDVFFETITSGNALTHPAFDRLSGRFDLVLGNPPYRRERGAKALLDKIARTELGRRWRAARMDLWYYFVHRAVELLADRGVLALIVNSYWTAGTGAARLVEHLRQETHVEEIFDLGGLAVFEQVAGRHLILLARKTHNTGATTTIKRPDATPGASAESFLTGKASLTVWKKTPDELFQGGRIDLEPVDREYFDRLGRGAPLALLGRVRQGIAENPATVTNEANRRHGGRWTVGEGVFALTDDEVELLALSEAERRLLRPYHRAREIGRYYLAERPSRWLVHSTAETCPDVSEFPAIERHLARFRPILEARRETRLGRRPWWQLHWPREEAIWSADKILSVQMARRPAFAAAMRPVHVNFSVNVFVPNSDTPEHLLYLTALLNSEPLWRWFRRHAKRRGVGLEINGRVLARTPIRRIDFADAGDRRMHDELVELAGAMHARAIRTCDNDVSAEIAFHDDVDRRIDRLVCRLYGLPDDMAC